MPLHFIHILYSWFGDVHWAIFVACFILNIKLSNLLPSLCVMLFCSCLWQYRISSITLYRHVPTIFPYFSNKWITFTKTANAIKWKIRIAKILQIFLVRQLALATSYGITTKTKTYRTISILLTFNDETVHFTNKY